MPDSSVRGQMTYERFLVDTALALLRSNQRAVFIVTLDQDGKLRIKTAFNDEGGGKFTARLEKLIDQLITEDLELTNGAAS